MTKEKPTAGVFMGRRVDEKNLDWVELQPLFLVACKRTNGVTESKLSDQERVWDIA